MTLTAQIFILVAQRAICLDLRNNKVVKFNGTAAGKVGRTLLVLGPSTATVLASELNLTGAAIRKHLDALEEEGLIESSERAPYGPAALNAPRGRGRPARVFSLTALGRSVFGQHEDSMALSAVKFMATVAGPGAITKFADHLASDFEARHADISALPTFEERAGALIDALNAEGFAATLTPGLGGLQICQHNCPMGDIAAEFPSVCDAETEAFSRITGVHVTRLATIAKGSAVCTTLVPLSRKESA